MKNHLMPLMDKLLLRKRFIIETLLVKLKSHIWYMGLEHTRHRSPSNALVHIFSCLAAYTLAQPKVTPIMVRRPGLGGNISVGTHLLGISSPPGCQKNHLLPIREELLSLNMLSMADFLMSRKPPTGGSCWILWCTEESCLAPKGSAQLESCPICYEPLSIIRV